MIHYVNCMCRPSLVLIVVDLLPPHMTIMVTLTTSQPPTHSQQIIYPSTYVHIINLAILVIWMSL